MVEAVLEPGCDAVDADRVRRRLDLVVGRVRPREADVVRDRPAEEERILQDDAELATVRAQPDVAEVSAVDAHGTPRRIVEARHELRSRRLAAARLADEGDAATRRDLELEAVDDRLRAVREDDAVEIEPTVDPPEVARAGSIDDVVLGVEHGRDLLHRGARRLHLPVQLRELLERLEDERRASRRPRSGCRSRGFPLRS